jgi:sporulation protein YlmC with PRC-barrel domain
MLKTHMTAWLVATAFMAGSAAAQTGPAPSGATDRPAAAGTGSTTSGSPAMRPGGEASPSGATAPPSSGATSGGMDQHDRFLTRIEPDQIQASRLIGTTVVGQNNEAIGDINDVIVDRNGQAVAVVVGVGGFLGIGEKDVAVPFQAVAFTPGGQAGGGAAQRVGSATTTGSTSGSPRQDMASNRSTATTGNTGAGGPTAANNRGLPDRIMLRMSKSDLQNAPAFQTARGGNGAGRTAGSTGDGGGSTAPGTSTAGGTQSAPRP